MPDPRDVLPVLGWWCAVLVAAAFGVGALRAAMDWRDARRREQAHADALACDVFHEAARAAGHRAGYGVGHQRGWSEGHATGWSVGFGDGKRVMARRNARAQLGLPDSPAQPWTFDPRTRLGRQLNGEG